MCGKGFWTLKQTETHKPPDVQVSLTRPDDHIHVHVFVNAERSIASLALVSR